MTWQLMPESQNRHSYVRMTIPGLDSSCIAGTWIAPPGGIPATAIAGYSAVQLLCAKNTCPTSHRAPITRGRGAAHADS